MERWAANTLRGLGILVTAVLMILACLLLLLLSLCTWKSPNNGQSVGFLIGAVLVLALGIFIIAKLARGLMNDAASQSAVTQTLPPGVPVHISPSSAEALNQLSYAIGANLALGVLSWGMGLYRVLTMHVAGPSGSYALQRPWLIASVLTALLEYLPYVLLLFRLQQKPDRPALAFAMGIPAASILHIVTSLPMMWRVFSYPQYRMQVFGPLLAALVLEIIILNLAWRANQRLGYRQEPVSLIIVAGAVYAYFIIFASANTWMYRFIH